MKSDDNKFHQYQQINKTATSHLKQLNTQ